MGPAGRERGGRLPGPVAPMLATAGPVPTGAAASEFGFEFKWDGVRAVTAVGGNRVLAMSRNGNDVTRSYPELAVLTGLLGTRDVVLDGEIVALDATGRARFDLLQQRMHLQQPTPVLLGQIPVTYVLFDLLHLDGQDLTAEPYRRRRALLDELDLDGSSRLVRVPPHYIGVDGQELLAVARTHHLEGVVAKRLGSRYEPGRRSRAWIKTALLNTQEVLIAGWKPGDGRRAGMIGSLLLGVHDEQDRLIYLGKVGTGFTDAMLEDLQRRLRPLQRPTSPFAVQVPREDARFAHWVTPKLVGEVEYRTLILNRSTGERRLRHAAWRGLREDKAPHEVKAPFFE